MVPKGHMLERGALVRVGQYLLLAIAVAAASIFAAPFLLELRQDRLQATGDFPEISDVIRSVKLEILRAQEKMVEAGEMPLFNLETFDLELKFIVSTQSDLTTEARFPELLVISDESSIGNERTQTIQLHFTVVEGKSFEAPVQPIPKELRKMMDLGREDQPHGDNP